MQYLLLIYFNNKLLNVSSSLAAHHQEVQHCKNSNRYNFYLRTVNFETYVAHSPTNALFINLLAPKLFF